MSAIHASNVPGTWVECKSRVHSEFSVRKSNSSITVLPRVLERIPVMLFVGDQDMICNYVGIESMVQSMSWNGETGLGVRPLPSDTNKPELILCTSAEGADAVVDGGWKPCRDVGWLAQPHLRQGLYILCMV